LVDFPIAFLILARRVVLLRVRENVCKGGY
jgi:hypothetical protein